jgi:hypothetical protein
MTNIPAPALVAEYLYGLVGSNKLADSTLASLFSYDDSPYTSSVETCRIRLIVPSVFTVSSNTCVPLMLFSVNSNELPNELSTCVCDSLY